MRAKEVPYAFLGRNQARNGLPVAVEGGAGQLLGQGARACETPGSEQALDILTSSNQQGERVTEDEVRTAIPAQGGAAVDAVQAVVLEADGSFTVIPASDHDATVLQGVLHAPLT